MINLQSRKNVGLTFVEVLLALFIMGSMLTSLFLAQNAILSKISYYSTLTDGIFLCKKKLFTLWFDEKRKIAKKTKKESYNRIALSYKKIDLEELSKFKNFPNMYMQQVTSSWSDLRGDHKEIIVNFIYKAKGKT